MSLTILDSLEQGSPEWHDQRRGMLTASVVGQLITAKTLKVAENDTSRGVTAQLVAERITGWTDPTFTSEDMWRGIETEPIARDWYSQHHAPVTEVGFMVRTFEGITEEPTVFQIGYSPDGLVGDDGLLEVKAPRAKTHIRTILSGEVPAYNMAQCQAGLLVSGRSWLDFVSYCGGLPVFVKRVLPDEKWHAVIKEAAERFEDTATQMQADYLAITNGQPTTERLAYLADVELKLS